MTNNIKLQSEDDIILFEDSIFRRKKYFLMSDSKEKYLKLTRGQFAFYKMLLPYLNGSLTKNEIKEKFSDNLNIDVTDKEEVNQKIESAIIVLDKHGLFKHNNVSVETKVEFELSGKRIVKFNLTEFQEKHSKILKNIFRVLFFVSLLSYLISLFLIIKKNEFIVNNFIRAKNFSWSNINVFEIAFIFILLVFSIAFHESGHFLVANYYDVKVKSLNVLLRMGISPVFYVKYKNFYAIKSITKVKILFAGAYFDLLLSSIYLIIINIKPDWKCAVLMAINFWLVFENMIPSGASDGFNIIATLAGFEGLRWNMLVTIGKFINNRKNAKINLSNFLFLIYFIVSYGITFYGLYLLIKFILDMLHVTIFMHDYLEILIIIVMVAVIVKFVAFFVKKLKKIGI